MRDREHHKEWRRNWEQSRKASSKEAYEALMKFYPLTLDNLDGEEWRDVDGYEGYQVSNFGRVKSFKRYSQGRISKPIVTRTGYLYVSLSKGKNGHPVRLHRIVAKAFLPNPDDKPQINHRDGCKLNNHVDNLEWVTQGENMQHASILGLRPAGENHVRAKFSKSDIIYIRENPNTLTQESLATKFGVAQPVISAIQLGKTYKTTGGKIHKATRPRISKEIRIAIRSCYKKGVPGYGAGALSKKFGVSPATISRIVLEI